MKKIHISIVDDHSLFRNGLRLILGSYPDMEIISECSNGKEFLDSCETGLPDIVFMDIEMPVMDGIEATLHAIQKFPDLKIITLSMYGEEDYYYRMIEAGAKGFILKNSDIDEVIRAIRIIYKGGTYFSQDVLYNVIKNLKKQKKDLPEGLQLSARETEILELICKGLSNHEIAKHLNISKRTVDKHRSNILEKTETKNTARLVMFAVENHLIEL